MLAGRALGVSALGLLLTAVAAPAGRAELPTYRLGRTPTADDEAGDTAYDVVLDYGDHSERLRYDDEELPGDVREALDARLETGA